jgi:hypothetical protein
MYKPNSKYFTAAQLTEMLNANMRQSLLLAHALGERANVEGVACSISPTAYTEATELLESVSDEVGDVLGAIEYYVDVAAGVMPLGVEVGE